MRFITSQVLSSNGNVVFSSIPQNFSHLQLRVVGRGLNSFSDGLTMYLTFNNNNTSTHYQNHGLWGNGSSASSINNLNVGLITVQQVFPDVNATANIFGVAITDILDYTSTTKNKTIRTIGGYDRNGLGRA
jgi:hypothetical protein